MLETFGILNIWAYALGALIIVMIPGPNTLFVLKTSIVDGRRAGFTAAAGVFTGDAVLVFLAYLGIAALVLAHPEVFFWLKILGAAYLAWLGGKAIHATFFAKKAEKAEGESEVVVKKSRRPRQGLPQRPCAEPHEPEVDSLLRLLLRAVHRSGFRQSGDLLHHPRPDP